MRIFHRWNPERVLYDSAADTLREAILEALARGANLGGANLYRKDNAQSAFDLKCSTVSRGIGCLPATEFKTKAYAAQDWKCNEDIPMPLPKLDG